MDNELGLTEQELEEYIEALGEAEKTWENDEKRRGRKKKDENNTL